jgi:HNH endonuclease
MKNRRINPGLVWKQFEDALAPRLRFSTIDRAVYSHLVRHSRLEGKRQVRFSIVWLARGIRVSASPTRLAVRRLMEHDALRLIERTKAGHVVEVRLPEEIRAARLDAAGAKSAGDALKRGAAAAGNFEETDFLRSKELRQAIHAREGGRCFYCMRRVKARAQCLDHVVPRVEFGCNSYRNLVSCCLECNSRKGETTAVDFLRWLYREERLSSAELTKRLRALKALASGKLRPQMR